MKKEKHITGYKFFKGILGFIFKIYYRPKIINKENIPNEGPIIVCGNHQHLFDQNLAILSTKRMLHYMAKIEYFQNKKTRWFFKASGCIPVDRKSHDGKAKEDAIKILNNGNAIGIFPEGTRNKTDDFLLPFKFGTVSMAQKTGAFIVPFAITGKYKFLNNHLNIRFGRPFKIPNDMDLEQANKKLFDSILNLKKQGMSEIEKGII
ncbi:MAG: lysophospholipid acyltransferase family protein [bacterium]|nr:lysophospholipid acyltransferase family protein [bacterium]